MLAGRVDYEVVAVSTTAEEDRRNACVFGDAKVFQAANSWNGGLEPRLVQRHDCDGVVEYVASRVRAGAVDLVQVEGFYLMQHVPAPCDVPVLLVEQNVEYAVWLQRVVAERNHALRAAHLIELRHTWTSELHAWGRSDLLAVSNDDDRNQVLAVDPHRDVRIVPDGNHTNGSDGTEERDPLVVCVGDYGHQPNEDAALHLCDEIVPLLRGEAPNVRVVFVGTSPSASLRARAEQCENVVVTGWVSEVEPYLDSAQAVVAPLHVGGEIRLKLLDALSRGRPIVATSVAAQALGGSHSNGIRIADEPGAFAAHVLELLASARVRRRRARAARSLAHTLSPGDEAAVRLLECYEVAVAGDRQLSA